MKRVLAAVMLCLAAVATGASTADAYPPGGAPLLLSATTVAPGQSFSVTLTQCALGETVQFAVAGSSAEATCTGAAGDARFIAAPTGASATGTLTAPTAPGTYTVTARGLTSGRSATATLTVAAPTGGTGGLPTTGSDTSSTLWVASGALLAGLGLAGVAWFRRRRPVTA